MSLWRFTSGCSLALLVFTLASGTAQAQAPQDEKSRAVQGGGISVPGWTGKIDASEEKAGLTLNNAKLAQQGDTLLVTTGPAVTYWNSAAKASGNYTVKATFTEPKYMNLNSHPHPYGIMIGGNDLGGAIRATSTAQPMATECSSCAALGPMLFR